MNLDRNKEFEARLRKRMPAPVPGRIEAAIERSLKEQKRRQHLGRIRSMFGWGAVALAASVVMVLGILLFNGALSLAPKGDPSLTQVAEPPVEASEETPVEAETNRPNFEPVLAENNLRNRVDEGIVFLNNGLTARRYRYEFIDRVVWRNPVDGATMEVEIPRDEVVLVPVQTF